MAKLLDVNEITDSLRNYTLPLPLRIEDGCIAASRFTEGGANDYAICFTHPEGSVSFGFDHPTNAEYYEFDLSCLQDDYAANRSIVNLACGLGASDEPPWAEVDKSGSVLPPQEAQANMHAWLQAPVKFELIEGLGDELSEFSPGIAVWEALDDSERKRFGLRKVNCGGPGSSVPAVAFDGSVSEFNLFLKRKKLPYRIEQEAG